MLRGAALLEQLLAIPVVERDAWIDMQLGFASPPPDMALPRGAVPYLPCGVAEILAMIDAVPVTAGDVFVDLGSGLGRVAILVHLLTGARTCGIEIQEHLVHAARTHATGLPVTFVHADAADTELAGTIFFLYAPFNGELLARVLRRLEAITHRFVVCTVDLALDLPWLVARPTSSRSLVVYDTAGR